MKGLVMLLNSMGIDGAGIMALVEQVRTQLPLFAAQLKAKVESMDTRLATIERNQALIMRALNIPVPAEPPAANGQLQYIPDPGVMENSRQ